MRLIDADTLKAEFTGNFHEEWHYTGIWATIDVAPTVEVEPVRHGHWTGLTHSAFHGIDEYGEPIYRDCVTYVHRKCGFGSVIKHNYCPRCGVKMDEGSVKENA